MTTPLPHPEFQIFAVPANGFQSQLWAAGVPRAPTLEEMRAPRGKPATIALRSRTCRGPLAAARASGSCPNQSRSPARNQARLCDSCSHRFSSLRRGIIRSVDRLLPIAPERIAAPSKSKGAKIPRIDAVQNPPVDYSFPAALDATHSLPPKPPHSPRQPKVSRG